jgi:hypothetical protein
VGVPTWTQFVPGEGEGPLARRGLQGELRPVRRNRQRLTTGRAARRAATPGVTAQKSAKVGSGEAQPWRAGY